MEDKETEKYLQECEKYEDCIGCQYDSNTIPCPLIKKIFYLYDYEPVLR